MAIVLLLVFLKLLGNSVATHCDKELDYRLYYGYEITCEDLSDENRKLLTEITISKEISLNINNSNLTNVTSDLFLNVRNIRYLFITNSTFLFNPNERIFANLTHLTHLSVANTRFSLNPLVLQGLDNLVELSLVNCSLKTVQNDTFVMLQNLETLNLSRNRFKTMLDIPFCALPALKYVDLEYNEIQRIEDNFFLCFQKQTESAVLLNGEDYRIKYHTDNMYSQAKSNLDVIELNLNHNNIEHIGHLEWALSLKNFDLSNNRLKMINASLFSMLGNLEKLSLENNLLESVDLNAFLKLENLKYINLENNSLPDVCLQNLSNLEVAHLSKNKLHSGSLTHLNNLPRLQQLFLSNNYISELPQNIFGNFKSLEILDLSNNRVVLSHQPFKNLTNLKQLSVRNNSLQIIPFSTFKNLSSLVNLDISENQLGTFSDSATFTGLENLQVLNMSHNLIENLNYDLLSPLRNLQVLDISGNRLQNFHVSLISLLPSLRVISIKSNLLPCSILATIIAFLKSKDISYTVNEDFEYDRQNVHGIYCEEMSSRLVSATKGLSVSSALGILFIVVVSFVLFAFMLYRCILYSKRRRYRMDEIELL